MRSALRSGLGIVVIALGAVSGCSITDPPPGPPAQLTSLPRELTADEIRVSSAANDFALRLLRRLSAQQPDRNVFISPLSVSMSLGMAMNGATGQTLDEMRATLGFGARELAEINAGYRGLMALESGLDPSTTFDVANSVWYRNGIPVHQSYLDVVKNTFDAEAKQSPFDGSTITAVNQWVSDNTNKRITEILKEISSDDVMFLINAIYFKGSWRDGFDPAATRDGQFTRANGSTQTVKLMSRRSGEGKLRYAFVQGTTVGELSYGNGAFVMTVLMPETQESVNALAARMDTTTWRSMLTPMSEINGDVVLPRLRLEYERDLKDDLKALGMQVPFVDGSANFSGLSPDGDRMFIAFVKHKTFVNVDEEGTEAAAVTNTGMGVTSLPPGLRVTKPFIFAIRERFSGTILFLGRIVEIPQ